MRKLTPLQFISLGYLVTIVAGSIFLCLPFATKSGQWVPFLDAMFTATSATCVTGLVVYDTYTQWSLFGQIIILILIQIGGLGFMTVITVFLRILRRNVGLYERTILLQSAGTFSFNGIMKLINRILLITLFFEVLGAGLLSIQFIPEYGLKQGIWYSIWHSVSAYCNAGFDLMGRYGKFSSLVPYHDNPLVILTIGGLILVGGFGFLVFSDIIDCKFRFKNLTTHSKLVIIYGLIITIVPIFLFLGLEWNHALKDENFWGKLLGATFMSITPRTAGFNSVSSDQVSEAGTLLTVILMFIGGNSGSTAGGVKVSTIVVVIANLYFQAKGKKEVKSFDRKINDLIIKQSSALVILYIIVGLLGTFLLCVFETDITITEALYESVSALSTVGLTLGVTPSLCWASKIILILLMYAGRVGALTLFSSFIKKDRESVHLKVVEGKILVG